MKLASFKAKGRTSYGAVTPDGGLIDLGRKLAKYPTLLDLFRAGAIADARAAATGAPDYQVRRPRRISASASTIRTATPSTRTAATRRNTRTCSAGFRPR